MWVVRELRSGLTLRSGWMSMQDQTAFENFLSPIATSGFEVSVVLSDKQRGLLPAIESVFPNAKHALCQSHYLKNISEPIATADETMKVTLRKKVRSSIGQTIRAEQVEHPGVLTVTGLLPSALELESSVAESESTETQRQDSSTLGEAVKKKEATNTEEGAGAETEAQQRDEIVTVLQQRIRSLLTLKGRPPFRLAGIEMYDRLSEVNVCLQSMLEMQSDDRLRE